MRAAAAGGQGHAVRGVHGWSQHVAKMSSGPVVLGFLHLTEFHSAEFCTEFPRFLISALHCTLGNSARGEMTKNLILPSSSLGPHHMSSIMKVFFCYFVLKPGLGELCIVGVWLVTVGRSLFRLLEVLQVCRAACSKGWPAGGDGPSALRCLCEAICVQVGASASHGSVGAPGLGLSGEGGQQDRREGARWGSPAHIDYVWSSFQQKTCSTAIADEFFLQLKPHVRPCGASCWSGEWLRGHGTHSVCQSLASEKQQPRGGHWYRAPHDTSSPPLLLLAS